MFRVLQIVLNEMMLYLEPALASSIEELRLRAHDEFMDFKNLSVTL